MENRNKMKQQTKSKALIILNIILLLALFTIPVYAYWAGKLNAPDQVTDSADIEIGEGQEITTVIELTKDVAGGKLVPEDRAVTDQVEQVVLTFDVLWTDENKASHGATGVLTVTPSFNNNPANLLKVAVNGVNEDGAIIAGTKQTIIAGTKQTIIAGTKQTITLTITLTEPATKTEYDALQAAAKSEEGIKLTVTFSVVPNE